MEDPCRNPASVEAGQRKKCPWRSVSFSVKICGRKAEPQKDKIQLLEKQDNRQTNSNEN